MPERHPQDQGNDALIICRCEGVTLGQLKMCIHRAGAKTINHAKKLTRAGMGSCQGRTCAGLVELILETEAHTPRGTEPYKSRPPVRAMPIGLLSAAADQFKEPAGPVSVLMLRGASDSDPSASEESEEAD